MEHEKYGLRRRAVVAVLGDKLDEAALVQELWFQHDSMRGDAVSDIIAFVDAVASRHAIDAATRKRLYGDFYTAMRQPPDALPLDPWPAMQRSRGAGGVALAAAAAPAATAAPVATAPPRPPAVNINPVAAALAQAQAAPAHVQASPASALPPSPAAGVAAAALAVEPPVVFGAVVRAVVEEVHRFHNEALGEVGRDALAVLDSCAAAPAVRDAFRAAWPRALQHDWQLPASPADLAELMRVINYALGEAFGRVGADQILQRALQSADALPEARQFSPKRLLASI